jgi:G:T/U-mismatch repair DNA glycosylase
MDNFDNLQIEINNQLINNAFLLLDEEDRAVVATFEAQHRKMNNSLRNNCTHVRGFRNKQIYRRTCESVAKELQILIKLLKVRLILKNRLSMAVNNL